MNALAPIRFVHVPPLRLFDHVRKHHGTATEVVGMDAEEQGLAYKDDITGSQVKVWVLRCGVTFVRRLNVGVEERCIPRPFGRCRGSG